MLFKRSKPPFPDVLPDEKRGESTAKVARQVMKLLGINAAPGTVVEIKITVPPDDVPDESYGFNAQTGKPTMHPVLAQDEATTLDEFIAAGCGECDNCRLQLEHVEKLGKPLAELVFQYERQEGSLPHDQAIRMFQGLIDGDHLKDMPPQYREMAEAGIRAGDLVRAGPRMLH